MILRRLCALGVLLPAALLVPTLARAEAPAASSITAQVTGPALALSPTAGIARDAFNASYLFGQPCPKGSQAVLLWDGQPVASGRASGSSCAATVRAQPPRGDSQAGPHDVLVALFACADPTRCSPVNGSQAQSSYTIVDQTGPPGQRTAPPTPTPTPTPVPTPFPIAAGGSFAPHDCRNGIPDTTPCPSPSGAVAGLVTGPAAAGPPATPPAGASPSGTSGGLSAATIGLVAGALFIAVAGALALALRTGHGRRRGRGTPSTSPPASGLFDDPPGVLGPSVEGFGPGRPVRLGRVPPPPSAPRPPMGSS